MVAAKKTTKSKVAKKPKSATKKITKSKVAKKPKSVKSTPAKKTPSKKYSKKTINKPASLDEAIKYPFVKWWRCYNFLWFLLPIIGWAALLGYQRKIITNIIEGKRDALPEFEFFNDMGRGWIVFGYLLVLIIVVDIISFVLMHIPVVGRVLYAAWAVFLALVASMLFVRVCVTGKFEEGFNVIWAWNLVTSNLEDYIVVLLKTFVASIVWLLSIVLLFIGVGASCFGKYYLMADFYARHVKS